MDQILFKTFVSFYSHWRNANSTTEFCMLYMLHVMFCFFLHFSDIILSTQSVLCGFSIGWTQHGRCPLTWNNTFWKDCGSLHFELILKGRILKPTSYVYIINSPDQLDMKESNENQWKAVLPLQSWSTITTDKQNLESMLTLSYLALHQEKWIHMIIQLALPLIWIH